MRRGRKTLMWLAAGFALITGVSRADVLRVGPGRDLARPSQAAAIVQPGDLVLIDAGEYVGDVAVWRANDVTIRGVGGRAHLKANGQNAQGKAIWVVQGDRIVIENIEFSGATVPDRNGAGIRQDGTGVTLRRCVFHHNENGILTSSNEASDIVIEECEFAHNGYGDGYSHNLYVGRVRSLTVRSSYFHHGRIGHNLKSRAARNVLLHNRIMDEVDGNASYQAEFPNGGEVILIGNVLQQSSNASNPTILSFGAEGQTHPRQVLHVVNNTFVNDRSSGTFVQSGEAMDAARIVNNLFVGPGRVLRGQGELRSNLQTDAPGFLDRARFDYRLAAGSPALEAGVAPGDWDGMDLLPATQYRHERRASGRSVEGRIDIGAYERGGEWSLWQQPLRRAQPASALVAGLEPGDFVFFLASFEGTGFGERVPGAHGLKLDLVGDVWLVGVRVANGAGAALLDTWVPSDAPLKSLSTQALVFRLGEGRLVKTNSVTVSVQPD